MNKHLKPAAGMKVYDPEAHAYLPEGGRRVAFNSYWARRLGAKEVTEVVEAEAKSVASNNDQSEED